MPDSYAGGAGKQGAERWGSSMAGGQPQDYQLSAETRAEDGLACRPSRKAVRRGGIRLLTLRGALHDNEATI